ncbi:hypothetical protein R3W88_015949 [Solanum pinnatisectum]|uniref:Uncharacterized protein n=1 Tax=Solanum pinnatisectum TaxID=50273 RepID=A0AAV9KVZ9_9SOLN|nr:hypothetical protein R3W88_015949 [Solanum pinnatisectum]
MAKEDSLFEMELHDEFVEMVTPVGEPNFRLLSPTRVSHSNCCNIQSVSVLPLPTVDHSVLEEIKKGKSIAFDHEDQDRSVNVKRRKFIEVASQKSKLKNWEFYFEVGKHKKPKLGAPNLDFDKSFEEKLTKKYLYEETEDDEIQLDGNGRSLLWHKFKYYISYGALSANRIPCPPRSGRSYYTHHCYHATGPAHPYTRDCSAITLCVDEQWVMARLSFKDRLIRE